MSLAGLGLVRLTVMAKETGGAALIAVFIAGVHVFLGFDQKSGAILGFFAFLASLYSIQ